MTEPSAPIVAIFYDHIFSAFKCMERQEIFRFLYNRCLLRTGVPLIDLKTCQGCDFSILINVRGNHVPRSLIIDLDGYIDRVTLKQSLNYRDFKVSEG